MVNIVNYGALDARPTADKRQSFAVYGGIAFLSLLVIAAVFNVNGANKTTELFEYNHIGAHSDDYAGTVEPSTQNDDQVEDAVVRVVNMQVLTRRCTLHTSGERNLGRLKSCLGGDR